MQPHTHSPEQPHYPIVEPILEAIAGWVNRYRRAAQVRAELDNVGAEEVARIAHDLNVSPGELQSLASKGPGSAALLDKMLVALGVDPAQNKHLKDPRLMRDLQRLCFACDHKSRCAHDLADGSAKEHYHEYCPNAYTLDVLTSQKQ